MLKEIFHRCEAEHACGVEIMMDAAGLFQGVSEPGLMFCALLLNALHRLMPAEDMVLLTGLEVVVSAAERVKKLGCDRAV